MARNVRYTPSYTGLRELAQSSGLSQASVDVAEQLARQARAVDPKGDYEAGPATVTAGRSNEPRAGAAITDISGGGARGQILGNLLNGGPARG